MQQFTVPQFIDVEDKIIGPITARQFIIVLSGFLLIGIFYKIFDFSLFIISGLLVLAVTSVIAFAKINGRPFHFFLLNIIQTLRRPHLRVWNNKLIALSDDDFEKSTDKIIEKNIFDVDKIEPTVSRLAELSLIVDTQGSYKGEGGEDSNIESV